MSGEGDLSKGAEVFDATWGRNAVLRDSFNRGHVRVVHLDAPS